MTTVPARGALIYSIPRKTLALMTVCAAPGCDNLMVPTTEKGYYVARRRPGRAEEVAVVCCPACGRAWAGEGR